MKVNKHLIPLNILIADDDKDDRLFFEKALKEIPISTQFTSVDDGEELMNYLYGHINNLPDLLFLDLSMPRKNGIECLSEIKENEQLKDLPVIMISTSYAANLYYESELIKSIIKIGAIDFIRKPSDYEQLRHVIHKSLIMFTELKTLSV